MPSLILVGDINLMNVTDAGVPFARVGETLREADLVFANLECLLYQPPDGHAVEHEGFFADPEIAGDALQSAGSRRSVSPIMSITARPLFSARSNASTGSASGTPAPARTWPRHAPRQSPNAAGCASAFYNAARSTGRPITKRQHMAAGSR